MQGKNKVLFRFVEEALRRDLSKGFSVLMLGPRQVGKTTLARDCFAKIRNKLEYPLQDPSLRLELEAEPSKLIKWIRAEGGNPHVFIDEAQKIPELFDAIQLLIDNKDASFLLTGSSARKLRRSGMNLLPGRIKHYHLDPLLWSELNLSQENSLKEIALGNLNEKEKYSFDELLIYGSLPGIVMLKEKDRGAFLSSYSEIYLEEEIRAESLSRKIGAFSRFLELAAAESGTSPNFTKLSNESGVSQPAIKEFYRLLEDTLVVERVDPYLHNPRKRILSSPRYYFFDIGVRNALARLSLDRGLINAQKGKLFEHAVMLEIIRRVRALNKNYKVCFWRTAAGAEVDCVIDMGNKIIPIEIKSSATVMASELKGLKNFLSDYKDRAKQGYVITMGKRKEKLAENIIVLPWFCL